MEERKALLADVVENPPAPTEEKKEEPVPPKPTATMDEDDEDIEFMTEQTYIPVEPKALFRSRPMYLIVRHIFDFSIIFLIWLPILYSRSNMLVIVINLGYFMRKWSWIDFMVAQRSRN